MINKTYEIIDKIDASHLKKRLDEIKIIINNDNEIKNIIKKFEESKELFEKYNIKDNYLKAKEELFQNDIIKEYINIQNKINMLSIYINNKINKITKGITDK